MNLPCQVTECDQHDSIEMRVAVWGFTLSSVKGINILNLGVDSDDIGFIRLIVMVLPGNQCDNRAGFRQRILMAMSITMIESTRTQRVETGQLHRGGKRCQEFIHISAKGLRKQSTIERRPRWEGYAMPIEFISSPTVLRRNLRRLISEAEEIEFFIASIDDITLISQLVKAALRGAEVNLTLTLDRRTTPDVLDRLIEAGVNVGVFEPMEFKKRPIKRFQARVYLFDNLTEWKTRVIVGGFDATSESLDHDLNAATLVESDDFSGKDEAGAYLLQLLTWIDALNFTPLDESRRTEHREQWEAQQRLVKAAGGAASMLEIKTPFISPLSWQELRGCDWATYFRGLLDTEIQRAKNSPRRLTGKKGWLVGIDNAQFAFREGPDRWTDDELRADLTGVREPTDCLGRCANESVQNLFETDGEFRRMLFEAVERCVADSSRETMLDALSPLLTHEGITVPVLSRFLAIAAPDRFISIQEDEARLRLSDVVGFDVSGLDLTRETHLARYLDAIEQIMSFPWASTLSAERSTEHPQEAEAWSKRMALLGCFVC